MLCSRRLPRSTSSSACPKRLCSSCFVTDRASWRRIMDITEGWVPWSRYAAAKCMSYVHNHVNMELGWKEAGTYCWGSNRAFSAGTLRRFYIFLFSLLKLAACKIKSLLSLVLLQRERERWVLGSRPTWLWAVSAPLWALLSRSVWRCSPPVQPCTSAEPDFVSLHCRQQISQTSSPSLYSGRKGRWQWCSPTPGFLLCACEGFNPPVAVLTWAQIFCALNPPYGS